MCCHPSINDHDRQAFLDSDNIPNLLETKEKIIKSREDQLKTLEDKLARLLEKNALVVNQSEYGKKYFLENKKKLEDAIHSIKYVLKIFSKSSKSVGSPPPHENSKSLPLVLYFLNLTQIQNHLQETQRKAA